MTVEEFAAKYISFKSYDTIQISCEHPHHNGDTTVCLNKQSARENVKKNKTFICEKCSFKEKCLSPLSQEHRDKISQGRKEKYREFTIEHRENISKATVAQYERGFNPEGHHLKGWHESPKAGKVFFRSSYEKKAYMLLDQDENIKSYSTEEFKVSYFHPIKKINSIYIIDLKIEHIDGTCKLIEVKPKSFLEKEIIKAKTTAALIEAEKAGMVYEIWTEVDLFGNNWQEKELREFVEWVRGELGKVKKPKKKYKQKYKKITFYCDYCQEEHTRSLQQYKENVEKNGRFICTKENGRTVGKSRKKEAVIVSEKFCAGCQETKPTSAFNPDKTKLDGFSSRCANCRNAARREKRKAAKES